MQIKFLVALSMLFLSIKITPDAANPDEFVLCNPNKIYAANDYLYAESYFKEFEKIMVKPLPLGGKDSLVAYFARKIKFTGEETQIAARYHVVFIVNCKGETGRLELKSKKFPGYDKVLEACQHMPKWTPAKKDNENVDCYYRLGFTNGGGKLTIDYRPE